MVQHVARVKTLGFIGVANQITLWTLLPGFTTWLHDDRWACLRYSVQFSYVWVPLPYCIFTAFKIMIACMTILSLPYHPLPSGCICWTSPTTVNLEVDSTGTAGWTWSDWVRICIIWPYNLYTIGIYIYIYNIYIYIQYIYIQYIYISYELIYSIYLDIKRYS